MVNLPTHTPSGHSTGTLPSGDVTLFYRRFGKPGATPLVIVHGLSYFSYDWIDIATALAHDREVVALDLRGFGESTWSPSGDYGLRTFAQDIQALLDHLGWQQAILVGHSMGGRICLCTAAWFPERVAALVCVDFAPDVAAAGRANVARRIGNQPDRFESVDHALAYHGYPIDLSLDAPMRRRFTQFLKPVDDGFVLKRDLHFRNGFRETLATGKSQPINVDLWALLAGLEIQVLFLRGTTSDMFAPETLEKVRAANPRVRAEELEGSHDLAGDNPEGLTEAVQQFIRTPV